MTKKQPLEEKNVPSRRDFMKRSSLLVAGGAVTSNLSVTQSAHAAGSDVIKIGLVGCGGRGTGAAVQAMNTDGQVQLVAMADAFGDRVQASYRTIKGHHPDKVDVPEERQFSGFNAYQGVLEADLDLVILATPPGFRPLHLEAAVNAGKHVFMEKPVAVDAPGVRRVLEATKAAKEKDLAVAVGLQRRHEERYRQIIDRLQNGAIGDINLSRVYWNGAGVWTRPRQEGQTELEYQMRNWYYFNWLCGDHIVEQHIHNLDVINWLKNDFPAEANGQGGREVRTSKEHGQIFDHHFVEFTYADGHKMFSQCRHISNCWNSVSEHVHGSAGWADVSGAKIYYPNGEIDWEFGRGGGGGHQEEHHHLFADLREGKRPNEGAYGAMSTMTSILGRLATYSGKSIKMADALASDIQLAPIDSYETFADAAPLQPDDNGFYAIPIPGKSEVV